MAENYFRQRKLVRKIPFTVRGIIEYFVESRSRIWNQISSDLEYVISKRLLSIGIFDFNVLTSNIGQSPPVYLAGHCQVGSESH